MDRLDLFEHRPAILVVESATVEVHVRRDVGLAIARQVNDDVDFRLKDRMDHLSFLLSESLEPGYKIPSQAQVNFAMTIASGLGIDLPEIVIYSKTACHDFISRNVDLFRSAIQKK